MNGNPRRTARSVALALAVAAVAVAGIATWLPAQALPGKLCCVAGEYRGSNTPDPLPNCPVPKSETFSMTISQSRGCGSSVWGRITDSSGHVNDFTGTLSAGRPRGCCVITASFSDPGHPGHLVKFTGTLCKRLGKWHASGTFTEVNSGDPCKKGGVWEITQN